MLYLEQKENYQFKAGIFLFGLFFLLFLSAKADAYPTFTPNSDLVRVAPYGADAVYGAANWGYSQIGYREFLNYGQKYRIRQNGTISKIRLFTVSSDGINGFYLKIWRKNSDNTFSLVGTSENLVSQLISGDSASINLSSPISGVQEGDFYGYLLERSGATPSYNFFALTGQTGVTSYFINNRLSGSNFDWLLSSDNALAGAVLPIELYMTAPQAVFIGDSIIAGHPAHYSFLEASDIINVTSTLEYHFGLATSYSYQNMGIGSQTTASITARFVNDVVNLKPRLTILDGGVNDIALNVDKNAVIANYTTILEACKNNNIVCAVVLILPWSNGTNAQLTIRDEINSALTSLVNTSYAGNALVVDASQYVGKFRSSGPAGNLWNIDSPYNADGVHFNSVGNQKIAQAIADALKPFAAISNNFSAWNGADIIVNFILRYGEVSNNLNLSNAADSGVEYSTDNLNWFDATVGTGGDGVIGLSGSVSGVSHTFTWKSDKDLPGVTATTTYLRIRPGDGAVSAVSWATSTVFNVDNQAPSGVGAPTFGNVTANSIIINKPDIVVESGSGLSQWQVKRDAVELGFNSTSTLALTDQSLLPDTQYIYSVQFKDAVNNISSYGTTAIKSTLANVSSGGSSGGAIFINPISTSTSPLATSTIVAMPASTSTIFSTSTPMINSTINIFPASSTVNSAANIVILEKNKKAAALWFTNYLFIGMRGKQVEMLQKKLQKLGYFKYPKITGYFGPITRRAVVNFQRAKKIKPPWGYVGPKTRKILNEL